MSRRILLLCPILTFFLLTGVASATDISDCTVIDAPGTYYLTADISDTATSYCMNISADDVYLDCQGHMIDAQQTADRGIWIVWPSSTTVNITVENCRLQDWDTQAAYIENANGVIFRNFTLTSNEDTGIEVRAQNVILDEISITTNPDSGIFCYSAHGLVINNSYIDAGTTTNTAPIRCQYSNGVYIGNTHSEGNYGYLHEFGNGPNIFENDVFIGDQSGSKWGFGYLFNGLADCLVTVTNVTGADGKEYRFYNSSVDVSNEELEGVYLCNADNSKFTNITIQSSSLKVDGFFSYQTSGVNITNSTFINYEEIKINGDVVLMGNLFQGSDTDGITIDAAASSSIIYNNTFYSHDQDCLELSGSGWEVYFNNFTACTGYAIRNAAGTIYNNYINADSLICSGTGNLNTTLQEGTRIVQGGDFNNPYIWGNFWDNSTGGYSVVCTDADKNGFCDDVFSPCGTDYGPYSDEYTESDPPRWDLNSTNSTAPGVWTLFSVRWNSSDVAGSNMSSFVFYFHNGANATQISSSGDQESGEQSEVASGGGTGLSVFDTFNDGTNWTASTGDCGPYWTYGSSTPSGGTGPQAGDSDDPGSNFVFMETSGGSCDGSPSSGYLTYKFPIDWDAGTEDNVTFMTNRHGNSDLGTMIVQENSSGSWIQLGTYSQTGPDGNNGLVWTRFGIDASGLAGTGYIRFYSYGHASYTGDAAIDQLNITSVGSAGGDANHTAIEYADAISGDLYEVLDNVTVTVNVSYYNTSGSVANGNTNATLWLEIYNGSDWIDEGSFSVTGTGNFTITSTTASVLSGWETEANRDIRISARFMDYNDTGTFDTINWTDVWVSVHNQQEYSADSAVSFTDDMCDIPKELCWSNVTKLVTSGTIKWYVWANTTTAQVNTTDVFQYETSAATFVDIIPSQALIDGIIFNGADPGSDDNAANNNTACSSGTCYNISIDPATTVNIDLYHTTTGDLTNDGSTMGIQNVTHQGNQTSSTGSNMVAAESTAVTLSYALIVDCSNVPDSNACHVRYWLDVPTGQSPGSYSSTYKYCAVETGSGSGECT